MQIHLPVTFNVNLFSKKRNDEAKPLKFNAKTAGAYEAFLINEVDERDAPLAVKWEQEDITKSCVGGTRWYQESHWEPVLGYRFPGEVLYSHMTSSDLEEQNCDTHTWSGFLTEVYHPVQSIIGSKEVSDFRNGKVADISSIDPRKIEINRRQEEVGRIQQLLDESFILVDGLLWSKSPEPIYRPERVRRGEVAGAIMASAYNSASTFRIDRYDDFVDFLTTNYEGERYYYPPRAEVLIPESINCADEQFALIENSKLLIDAGFQCIKTHSHEDSKSWYDLRDAYNAISSVEDDFQPLAEALRVFVNNINLGDADVLRMAERTLKRWDLRPLDGGLDFKF